ncbi:hypothetical protein F751_1104 [Auxenochlorella protothecoides]|uniref:Uncharacterized protein n=1 Tax=Auxenochlorella protothecoides TaxID=3075 RepID=A0A087SCF4_AUXPR|nr:hypothetical protein F751_1104 [Auxenochlorella protothecoides]KFM23408.1 hypothetical protein F751_1104 [Auxenochlorella protothecoides]
MCPTAPPPTRCRPCWARTRGSRRPRAARSGPRPPPAPARGGPHAGHLWGGVGGDPCPRCVECGHLEQTVGPAKQPGACRSSATGGGNREINGRHTRPAVIRSDECKGAGKLPPPRTHRRL